MVVDFVSEFVLLAEKYRFLFTVAMLLSLFFIRYSIIAFIRHEANFLSDAQRKWIARTKNWSIIFMVAGIFLVWKSEISEFALSLTAITFALVVASKEIILCFTGSFQRASSGSFHIGEWIEVGSYSGEVIDHNLMATQIQEIDMKTGTYAYTGRVITLPNSLFFTYPVKNLYFMKRYVYHEFNMITKENANLFPLIPSLNQKIEAHCYEFHEVAARYNHMLERHAGIDLPGSEPLVFITSSNFGDPIVHVRLFCPTERAMELEQLIKKDFMTLYDQHILSKHSLPVSGAEAE